MTKSVRIENADTSDHKVNVFVEQKNAAGEWVRQGGPTSLNFPTQLHTGTIFREQRLVIEEAP
jgi:hypothetical protein